MTGTASRKVPDGKLVRVEVEADQKLENISIRGDFFIEPPEALHELEERLEGLEKDFSTGEAMKNLGEVEADLIGFSHRDVVECLREAVEDDS